jgi:hypothetical protein
LAFKIISFLVFIGFHQKAQFQLLASAFLPYLPCANGVLSLARILSSHLKWSTRKEVGLTATEAILGSKKDLHRFIKIHPQAATNLETRMFIWNHTEIRNDTTMHVVGSCKIWPLHGNFFLLLGRKVTGLFYVIIYIYSLFPATTPMWL